MQDKRGPVPYGALRAAAWALAAFGWPAIRVIRIVFAPRWGASAADGGAVVTMLAVIAGRLAVRAGHERMAGRVALLSQRVDEWDRCAALLSLRPGGNLRLVHGGQESAVTLAAPPREDPLPLKVRGDKELLRRWRERLHGPDLHDDGVVAIRAYERREPVAGFFPVPAEADAQHVL